jgi:UDP:flavonoid glycosyltransferase YjiC (YdhE family)
VPFVFDQFYWGKRISSLGVGPKPIPHKALTADRLIAALDIALNDSQMRMRAIKLGEKIREEQGVIEAINLVELYLQ